MLAKGLNANVVQARFFQSHVATGAAVGDAEFGQPDLLNAALKMALERDRIAAVADHFLVAVLIVAPFAEMIFGGGDGERNQKHKADYAEGANAISE